MKKKNSKILSVVIFASLLLTGCNRERIFVRKESKANTFSIHELSVYSAEERRVEGLASRRRFDVIDVKFDVNNDGVFSIEDGDYYSKYYNVDKSNFLYQLVTEKGKKKLIYVSSDSKKLNNMNTVVGIEINDKDVIFVRKPSEIYNGAYEGTERMQKLNQIFDEKYLNKGR